MNIVDENMPESQCRSLRRRRIPFRQIGQGAGRSGMRDREIVTLLHQLDRPTFFTLDRDFYRRRLSHEGYCIVYLDVVEEKAAWYVRRLLRHRELKTKAQRMGRIIRVRPTGMTVWQKNMDTEIDLAWR